MTSRKVTKTDTQKEKKNNDNIHKTGHTTIFNNKKKYSEEKTVIEINIH